MESKLHHELAKDYELTLLFSRSLRVSRFVIACLKIYLLPYYAKYVESFEPMS